MERGCGARREHGLGSHIAVRIPALPVFTKRSLRAGTVPGDGDVRVTKVRFLPQGEESSQGELISKYITNQCGKCSKIDMPRSWEPRIISRVESS